MKPLHDLSATFSFIRDLLRKIFCFVRVRSEHWHRLFIRTREESKRKSNFSCEIHFHAQSERENKAGSLKKRAKIPKAGRLMGSLIKSLKQNLCTRPMGSIYLDNVFFFGDSEHATDLNVVSVLFNECLLIIHFSIFCCPFTAFEFE